MENFVTEIEIKKVRHLENLKIPLSKAERKHLILTGKNGSGKTSVLEEINHFIVNGFNDFSEENIKNIIINSGIKRKVQDVIYDADKYSKLNNTQKNVISRQKALKIVHKLTMEEIYKNIDLNLLNKYIKNICLFNIKNIENCSNSFFSFMKSLNGKRFIYSYFKSKRKTEIEKPDGVSTIKLDNNSTKEKQNSQFLQYLVNLEMKRLHLFRNRQLEELEKLDKWFESFENILKKVFNEENLKLEFIFDDYDYKIHIPNREPFDFNTLSDGYSAILDIITEIIIKIEASESKSFDIEGLVLIDEVETHLHLELQKQVLPLLTTLFPNIQFIVTTHSPFVLSSIENSVIYDLENRIRIEDLSGASYTGLIRKYFGLSSQHSKEFDKKFERFRFLANRESLTDSEDDELIELDIEFKKESPLFSAEKYAEYQKLRKSFL